ncbi:hypothetical protein TIFTF001_037139 [Ficus carica]|uniref:Uncharacterized protein n=1 Tax=Ficus carica TaxID=3494 RepID=A0AA88E6J6_FICCA|nr:hypothetical protein TIFTF001_037139 [Ficus carica]
MESGIGGGGDDDRHRRRKRRQAEEETTIGYWEEVSFGNGGVILGFRAESWE